MPESQSTDTNTATATAPEAGGPTMQLQIDDRQMNTHYVNACRSSSTSDEVVIDLGFNTVERQPQPDAKEEAARNGYARLQINTRAIMNYTTAKRLALTLGQIVRRYENQFGEIQLKGNANPAASTDTSDQT